MTRRDWSKPRPPPGTRTIIWRGERFRLELEIVVPKYEALGVGPHFYHLRTERLMRAFVGRGRSRGRARAREDDDQGEQG